MGALTSDAATGMPALWESRVAGADSATRMYNTVGNERESRNASLSVDFPIFTVNTPVSRYAYPSIRNHASPIPDYSN